MHENVCKNHDYHCTEMPEKDNNMSKNIHEEKSMKVAFVIYADAEPLLEKIDTFYSNWEKLSIAKVNKHTACGYSLFTHYSFNSNKNKHDYYRGEDCTKNFCKRFKEYKTEIIDYAKRKILPLTEEEKNYMINKKFC